MNMQMVTASDEPPAGRCASSDRPRGLHSLGALPPPTFATHGVVPLMTADPDAGTRQATLRSEFASAALGSLTRLTDPATYSRALAYANEGAVLDIAHLQGTVQLRGHVRGSR